MDLRKQGFRMEIVFYRNLKMTDFYLLHSQYFKINTDRYLGKFNHTGEFINSGYPKIEIEFAFRFQTDEDIKFFEYLADIIPTNYIKDPFYNGTNFRAWCEFKSFDPEKWLNNYQKYQEEEYKKYKESLKNNQIGVTQTLFY